MPAQVFEVVRSPSGAAGATRQLRVLVVEQAFGRRHLCGGATPGEASAMRVAEPYWALN